MRIDIDELRAGHGESHREPNHETQHRCALFLCEFDPCAGRSGAAAGRAESARGQRRGDCRRRRTLRAQLRVVSRRRQPCAVARDRRLRARRRRRSDCAARFAPASPARRCRRFRRCRPTKSGSWSPTSGACRTRPRWQPPAPPGNAAAGEAVFTGKGGCAACHQVNARGGLIGPDLSTAGTRSPDVLRHVILNPGAPLPGGGRGGPARPAGRVGADARRP